jgi:hypothetical protein
MKKYNTYKILLVFLALIISCFELQINLLYSQPVIEEWVRRYPDSGYGFSGFSGIGHDIITDDYGNSYVTGSAILNSNDIYCCTIKYKPNGDSAWTRLYSNEILQAGRSNYAIAIDKSSNIYTAGGEWVSGNSSDFLIIKYDSSGNQKWVKHYNGLASDEDGATAIVIDNAGNIYVTGYTSYGGNSFAYCTIKYNSSGDEIWVRHYGIPRPSTQAKSMTVDANCNIYITGTHNYRLTTISYDSSGNLRWAQVFQPYGGEANSIALDSANNVFITGFTYTNNFITIKYSSTGEENWIRYYSYTALNDPSESSAFSIKIDKTGNVYVGGNAKFTSTGKAYLGIIKYNNSGDTIWERHFQLIAIIYPTAMTIDSFNNIYITAGAVDSNIIGRSFRYFTLCYDSVGKYRWSIFYEPYSHFESKSTCITTDNYGNVFVSGFAANPKSVVHDLCTVKYSQPLFGIKKIDKNIPYKHRLYQNYPNPFNPETKIKFDVAQESGNQRMEVKIIIFDVLGRIIDIPLNEYLSSGYYELKWNSINFSTGIYFYQLCIGNISETNKMVLIK